MYKNNTTIYLMGKISSFSIFIFIFLLASSRVSFATPQQEVLGYSSNSNAFPAVTAGAGFLLPDSPLYFADKIFQSLKLAIALTPEKKTTVQTQILGERMAELREMYARKNSEGIVKALWEIEKEGKNLAASVRTAASQSDEAFVLAKKANDVLTDYRLVLAKASSASSDELSLKLDSTNYSLLVSKVEIEDFLSIADQEDAIASDLETEVENAVLGTSTKAEKLELKISNLEKRASRAAQLEQKKLEQKAKIKAKKQEAKQIIEKRKKLMEERKKKLEAARETLKKVREAALRFKEAQKAESQLKKETENESEDESKSSNSGSGSSNSGSGSSNSGSGSSVN